MNRWFWYENSVYTYGRIAGIGSKAAARIVGTRRAG